MTMPAIETLLQQPAAQAVAWALLQFVWQGAAIGIVTAVALAVLRRSAADVRYVVSAISLSLMLTLAVVTGVQKYQSLVGDGGPDFAAAIVAADRAEAARKPVETVSTDSATAAPAASGDIGARLAERLPAMSVERVLPPVMLVWLVGVAVLSLRLLSGWLWVQRLRTRGVVPASAHCRQLAARLSRRLHIGRAITLLESTLVDVPTVIGFLKPVVLLPASALGGLTPQQLEAILAHELAHVRRHDYLVNLLQTLVETVLFYHPAVWWVSRRIRVERENCCDDLAVSLCGDRIAYAAALADLEALRSGPQPDHHIAMAATGGSLLMRVRRLLGAPASHTGRGPAWLAGSVALLLIGGIAVGADASRQDLPAPMQPPVPVLEPIPFQPPPPAPPAPPAPAARPVPVGPAAAVVVAGEVPPAPSAAPVPPAPPVPVQDFVVPVAPPPAPVVAIAVPVAPVAAAPVAPVAPPAAPVAVAPAPPAPPAPAGNQSISHQVNDSKGNWVWSSDGEKLEVSYEGTFEFNETDTDVKQISAGGYLKVSDGKWLGRHSVEIRERNGQLERRYYVNASERPYEPEGRAWLSQNLPKFIRNTGIGAPARVARHLQSGGVPGVLAEVGRISSTYVKGIYFRELFKQATLTPEQYRQVMAQASVEMRSSSYELARFLIAVAERLPNDDVSRAAYFKAAGSIDSDYELRRVYSTMLKRGPVSSQVLTGILEHTVSIQSDYEMAETLRQIVLQQSLDDRNRAAFFKAVATIDGDYEQRRVLSAVMSRQGPSDPALIEGALGQALGLDSDHEASSFLLDVLRQNGIEGAPRAAFFKVVATLNSGYERGRVLQAVVKKPDASADTLREVLRATAGMSGYELSQVLQMVARTHTLQGDLRDAYLAASDRLAGHEQTQALAALTRAERRK